MIPAYSESLLEDAMTSLAIAFDYSVHHLDVNAEHFVGMFMTTGYANRFGRGDSSIISGLSGIEMACRVLGKEPVVPDTPTTPGEDYWCGWILAYYQWRTGLPFSTIIKQLPLKNLRGLYPKLHQTSEERASQELDSIIIPGIPGLKELRILCSYTQKKLSEASGVNLRTLQQYESGARDLSEASGTTLLKLSRALCCRMEDLIIPSELKAEYGHRMGRPRPVT